ncbi:MAG: winged helix-turn-helix domain-containing protein [Gemmatimonadota bacterium]|nr:winged helix-turn-helix domain-containing protein [Gemmatimonadota bacterium]
MPVPDFQTLMLPLLRFAGDAKEHSVGEARAAIASDFKLTSDELAQKLPSGRAPLFANRLAWAKQYLSAAGLLDTSKRAHFVITSDGAELLDHLTLALQPTPTGGLLHSLLVRSRVPAGAAERWPFGAPGTN